MPEKEPKSTEKDAKQAEKSPAMNLKLEVPDFIKPSPLKIAVFSLLTALAGILFLFLVFNIVSGRSAGASVLVIGKDLLYLCVVFLLQAGIFFNQYLPFLKFGYIISLLLIIIAIAIELAYLWLLASIAATAFEKREAALAVIFALVILIAFIITPLRSPYDDIFPRAECVFPIIRATACFNADGSWNSAPSNMAAQKYDVPLRCLQKGGALDNTPYKYNESSFNCGIPPV